MNNFTKVLWICLFITGNMFAQQEKGIFGATNWLNYWTEFKSATKDYGEPNKILTGDITEDTKLNKRDIYLLVGNVFVKDGAVLTIEPGTVIIGDYETKASLTITRGSKIIADGYETDPIVFTSEKISKRPGDWGGVIILGNAPSNKFGNGSVAQYYNNLDPALYASANFGGNNADDNSGILRYVRIEYAGNRLRNIGYTNGLLLAGVGGETIFENVMASYCAGDSFKAWGGSPHLKKLVSYKASGNDYKFNFGAQAIIENSIAIRSPYVSNSEVARSLQVKSYNNIQEVDFSKNNTFVAAKNLTFVTTSDNINSDIEKGLVNEAVYVGENASLDLNKSVISGFNPAVIFQNTIRINQENLDKIKFSEMYFNNCNGNIFIENNTNNEDLENWYGNSAFFNVYSKGDDSETFIDSRNEKKPDFRLRINKIMATNLDPELQRD
ncbi:hypothetical protein PW52_13395 [Tamlana sedimentorum]|uniref:Right handed beta helix domain-containing protein n=1 Tax=Neotamlana sedimentorum TaxID=1435349 RepID=A0A0D7W554_9FLAO|nr:hypothetical protein [Tamlana sedimentorum]KJD34241.1 hypothetical protein PW52_13395 [Tamlana sedimentorum]